MALGKDTKEMLAVKLPNLAPIAEKLEEAIACADHWNDGYGVFTLYRKKKKFIDVQSIMKWFTPDDEPGKRIS